jgi:AbrB family looped-hinge helix DNA binding protein
MEEAVVDDRGRVLIPKHMRESLGLQPGRQARLEMENGRLIITPPKSPEEFIRKMEGCIKKGMPTIDPLKLKEIWEKTPQNQ